MSCVPITDEMAALLADLQSWPPPPEVIERWKGSQSWVQARQWGWIMESGQLTGFGYNHAGGDLPRGILPEKD
jgi:hypothetical protein